MRGTSRKRIKTNRLLTVFEVLLHWCDMIWILERWRILKIRRYVWWSYMIWQLVIWPEFWSNPNHELFFVLRLGYPIVFWLVQVVSLKFSDLNHESSTIFTIKFRVQSSYLRFYKCSISPLCVDWIGLLTQNLRSKSKLLFCRRLDQMISGGRE